MRSNSFRANNLVVLAFVILSCIVAIGILFFPDKNIHYSFAISLLGGFYFTYIGIRKVRQTQQQRIHWYAQPYILIGIAFLLGLPWNLLQFAIIPVFPNSILIENVLAILGLILFLTAGYLFFRHLSKNNRQE